MIHIYAKYGTKERKMVFINPNENNIQQLLRDKYEGEWVLVNTFKLGDELHFETKDDYLGFDVRKKEHNYCEGNLKQGEFKTEIKRFGN